MYLVLTHEATRLPLYIGGAGMQTPQNEIIRPQGMEWHQLAFVTEGRGLLEFNGERHELHAGDCFILAKQQPHAYSPSSPPFHTLWVIFDGRAAHQLVSLLTDGLGTTLFTLPKSDLLLSKARAFVSTVETAPPPDRISTLLYDLLIETLRQKEAKTPRRMLTQRLAPALSFMTAHHTEAITLDEIAATVSLSKFTFIRLFREGYGVTPFVYLTQLRLQTAKNLLSMTNCSVKEAALNSGFRDVSYFGATFRRFEHLTPKEFQQQFDTKR